jgi:hypothetical protein
MPTQPATVDDYLAALTADRREALEAVRQVVNDNLPAGYEETMQHGMISWVVPLARYPDTYNGEPLAVASLASQKRHMSLYLMCVYGDAESSFRERYLASGKRLDMGKSCVRFRTLDDLPLDLIADEIAATPPDKFIADYEASRRS